MMALPAAKQTRLTWRVPVSVVIGQSALETGWGRKVVGNAYFGIKGKAPDGKGVDFATTEVIGGKVVHLTDGFRAYTSYADSADDYGRFLNQNARYGNAFHFLNNPDQFITEVAKAGYATDPNYAKSVISIMHGFQLSRYDK